MKMKKIGKRLSKISEPQVQHLINNHFWNFVYPDTKPFPFENEDERRLLYFKNKEKLWKYQGQEPSFGLPGFNYGDRPHAFWKYELGIDPDEIFKNGKERYQYLKKHKLIRPGEEKEMFRKMAEEKAENIRLYGRANFKK